MDSDAALRELLREIRTIAVLGMKGSPAEDAYRVPAYMQRHGYRIQPVNPKLECALDEPAVASLAELATAPDLVNVFRAPQHVPAHVPEILALDPLPKAVWLQLGIRHEHAARELRGAGIAVVQDLCLMVEHARLLGAGAG